MNTRSAVTGLVFAISGLGIARAGRCRGRGVPRTFTPTAFAGCFACPGERDGTRPPSQRLEEIAACLVPQ